VTYSIDSSFPLIGEYGFLSDCHTCALMAPDGSIEWLCLPRFDSASVCGAVLDRAAGHFRLGPSGLRVPLNRRYEPGTNVLETTWMTESGWLVVRDALTIGEWRDDPTDPHLRPPSDHEADHALVRVAECIQGEVSVEMICDLAFDYGRKRPQWSAVDGQEGTLDAAGCEPAVRLRTDLKLPDRAEHVAGHRRLQEGESCFCSLSWAHDLEGPGSLAAADTTLAMTRDYWRRWLADGRFPDHPWRIYLQRSALALKGLTYSPTGAVVAAATTSLPESPGGERNWDYRYSWIRDASFTLWGLNILGFDDEASDYMEFVGGLCGSHGPDTQIMYGIGGEHELPERTLDHLRGYGGARPVRVGNAAHEQRQNDVYGALLDAAYIHSKARAGIPDRLWSVLRDQVEGAVAIWEEPDQGIWEGRGEPKHYVSSKLMCWVALDRGRRLARQRDDSTLAKRWSGIADQIRGEILERGISDRGVFRQHYGTDALDASTLLVPLVRFLRPDDERVRATVLAIASELTDHGLVRRYKVEETDDGLSGDEGSFTICSFWMVAALSEIGERVRARQLCERLLAFAGTLDLYAEEIAPQGNSQLGNFPQAFSHLALINAVSHVIADEIAERRPQKPTAVFSELGGARADR
jgi:alpha,alpha-trehalase